MVIDVASALQSSPLGILLNRVSQIAHLTSYQHHVLGSASMEYVRGESMHGKNVWCGVGPASVAIHRLYPTHIVISV